jgi:hypothetical protein
MTALQIFFNSLRSRTIVRAIWMPVLIGILLIGACIPSKHATRAGEAASDDAAKGKAIFQSNHPSARAGRWENKAANRV